MAVLSKGSVVISLHALLAYISKLASRWISQVVLEGGRARHVEVHLFTWETHSQPPPLYLVLPLQTIIRTSDPPALPRCPPPQVTGRLWVLVNQGPTGS